jgi:hypothetical protein
MMQKVITAGWGSKELLKLVGETMSQEERRRWRATDPTLRAGTHVGTVIMLRRTVFVK